MAFRGRTIALRAAAAAACIGMALSAAACSSGTHTQTNGTGDDQQTLEQQTDTGSVAIFTPSDGLTISSSTPMNTWTKFVPALVDALRDGDVAKDRITTSTADDLDTQSRDIQDYVVDHIAEDPASNDTDDSGRQSAATIVVAPAIAADEATRQYGDYVSRYAATSEQTDADQNDSNQSGSDQADAADGASDGEDSETAGEQTDADETASEHDERRRTEQEAANRLVSSLRLAQRAGMHVVVLAGTLEGFTPDVCVRLTDAERIGAIQAQKVADKLELESASTDNPKAIEVLLPYQEDDRADSDTAQGADGDPVGDPSNGTPTGDSAAFARQAFAGIWSVLQPYFEQGKAFSPSGTLSSTTTADDWQSVAFAEHDGDGASEELDQRLGMQQGDDAHTRIDGVIAMNDHTAADVIAELEALGYTGSAADINPSITISGIVGNITGKKDLKRGSVPDPIKSPEADGQSESGSDEVSVEQINARWPIVTGYGAYVDAMPQIVAGKQWMTATEDRDTLAQYTATACLRLNTGQRLDDLDFVTTTTVNDEDVPTISEDLLAVSASNLKATLIDPGYITLAEAGL